MPVEVDAVTCSTELDELLKRRFRSEKSNSAWFLVSVPVAAYIKKENTMIIFWNTRTSGHIFYMASTVSGQDEPILGCDWLPDQARRS